MQKLKRIVTCLLAVLLVAAVSIPARAATSEEVQRIRRKIASDYYVARRSTGMDSLKGYCGTQTSWQLYLIGVNKHLITNNGNGQYDYYRYMEYTTGGHKVKDYPVSRYSMEQALYAATDYGKRDAYNLLIGFQRTNTEAGAIYGHAVVIYAILDGMVYFTEGFSTSFGGVEGQAMVLTIPSFVRYYRDWTTYEGMIEFGKKDLSYNCEKHDADYYATANRSAELYTQPTATPEEHTQAELMRKIRKGERLYVTGVFTDAEGNHFCRVTDSGEVGYVAADALTLLEMRSISAEITRAEAPQRIAKGENASVRVTFTVPAGVTAELQVRDYAGVVLHSAPISGYYGKYDLRTSNLGLSQLEEGAYSIAVFATREHTLAEDGELIPMTQQETILEMLLSVGQTDAVPARIGAEESFSDGWNYYNDDWYYYKNGAPYMGWLCYQGVDYYLQEDGSVTTGWTEILGKLRFFTDTGVMRTGWLEYDGNLYYLMCNGVPVQGWRTIDGKLYYFNESGVMLRNQWLETDDGLYLLQMDGTALTDGWFDTTKGRLFFHPEGYVQAQQVKENGTVVIRPWVQE